MKFPSQTLLVLIAAYWEVIHSTLPLEGSGCPELHPKISEQNFHLSRDPHSKHGVGCMCFAFLQMMAEKSTLKLQNGEVFRNFVEFVTKQTPRLATSGRSWRWLPESGSTSELSKHLERHRPTLWGPGFNSVNDMKSTQCERLGQYPTQKRFLKSISESGWNHCILQANEIYLKI
jgi:hypothetical protein